VIGMLVPDWPAPASVRAVTTTRAGGQSQPPWDSLNLAKHVGDNPALVETNRLELFQHLQLDRPVQWLNQVHGSRLVKADQLSIIPAADAVWTDSPQQVCAVMTADCLPVLLCESQGRWVTAIHAGWRGLAQGIVRETLQQLRQPEQQVLAWLGPAIGPASFEVGAEVRETFLGLDSNAVTCFQSIEQKPGHYLADIYALARLQLKDQAVISIGGGNHCTYQENELFYSYRRDGVTGRMATLIWLEK